MEDRAVEPRENRRSRRGHGDERSLVGSPAEDEDDSDTRLRSICADFTLSNQALALTEASAAAPHLRVRPERIVPGDDGTVLVATVTGERFEAFERALDAAPDVRDRELLDAAPESRTYRVTLTGDQVTVSELVTLADGRLREVVGADGQWDVRARFRSRERFLAFRTDCADRGIEFRLHRLCRAGRGAGRDRNGLTPEQWDALIQAHAAGYFDVPRGVSQSELAERMGVSPSAVSQRIRRATSRLVESQLDTERD